MKITENKSVWIFTMLVFLLFLCKGAWLLIWSIFTQISTWVGVTCVKHQGCYDVAFLSLGYNMWLVLKITFALYCMLWIVFFLIQIKNTLNNNQAYTPSAFADASKEGLNEEELKELQELSAPISETEKLLVIGAVWIWVFSLALWMIWLIVWVIFA